ncbi:MAG: hypothetical protein ACRDOH_36155 [Streptosporangiaceae bacterium]
MDEQTLYAPGELVCIDGRGVATRAELIAGHLSPEGICTSIGADSLGYVSSRSRMTTGASTSWTAWAPDP